jgi:hypothetical protein
MRHVLICITMLLPVCCVGSSVGGNAASPIKDMKARRAIADFDRHVRRAMEDYEDVCLKARADLIEALKKAQEDATESGRLDEAVEIGKVRQEFVTAARPPQVQKGPIKVISAVYGQNVSWRDVTAKAQLAVKGRDKWSAVVRTQDWEEPAPGWNGTRTLIVYYEASGRRVLKTAYQGNEISLP